MPFVIYEARLRYFMTEKGPVAVVSEWDKTRQFGIMETYLLSNLADSISSNIYLERQAKRLGLAKELFTEILINLAPKIS